MSYHHHLHDPKKVLSIGPHVYLGALDQGTTSTRCIFFTTEPAFQIAAKHQREHAQLTPKPGWLEHDPQELVANCVECINLAYQGLIKRDPDAEVASFGFTTQRETTIPWRISTGQPLYNAIVWGDVRTQPIVDAFVAEHSKTEGNKSGNNDFLRDITGLPCSTYFSAFKMKWLLEKVPAVKEAADEDDLIFGTIDTWLLKYFNEDSDINVTDITAACRTMLMNINNRKQYDPYLIQLFGIPPKSVPHKICPNNSPKAFGAMCCGEIDPQLLRVPITGCIGDQMGALFGHMCFEPGEAKNTYGTGCFLLANVGDKPKKSNHGLLSTVSYEVVENVTPPDGKGGGGEFKNSRMQYSLEGAVGGAGSMMQWIRDKLELYHRPQDVDRLALSVPSAQGVVFVPAFGGLLAPYWRPDARAIICGMTLQTTKGHIVKAALDGIAHQVADVVTAIEKDFNNNIKRLRVDGGLANSKVLIRTQANLMQHTNVELPSMLEATALGAALLGGLGVGLIKNTEHCKKMAYESATYDNKKRPEAKLATKTLVHTIKAYIGPEEVEKRKKLWREGVKRAEGWAKL